MYSLDELFRGSTHKASVFSPETVKWLESRIAMKPARGGEVPYVKCIVRNKEVRLTPEEAVRQMYVYELIHKEGYPAERIQLEQLIPFGRDNTKRADIVILSTKDLKTPYIIVEVKKPDVQNGVEQLKSYCNASGASAAVWTNGERTICYKREKPNIFVLIERVPKAEETPDDVQKRAYTIDDLTQDDILKNGKESLKALIQRIEDKVLASAGVDAFDEIFKLIYTKLYDETESGADKNRGLQFRKYGGDDEESQKNLKRRIQALFDAAKSKWKKVFDSGAKIELTPSHLDTCIESLQSVKLLNSNLDILDDAFEFLMSKSRKGEKGQFFTPRYVIEMCVRMLNPQKHESMIDTAAGSCGFPVHTIFHVWEQIRQERGDPHFDMFTAQPKHEVYGDYVREKVFAIDFDPKAVQVARTLNLLAGDGKTNVMRLNTLDYGAWKEDCTQASWLQQYGEGWSRLIYYCETEDSYRDFTFDIVMANPPFAGDIHEERIIRHYDLAKDKKGKHVSRIGRDILFIERNLQFLKPGGRMAIILPQGRFNNSSDKYIRDFIAERCRILAVIGLHENVFKPHTGTKTSVLFVQKWDDELCPRVEDYPVFFAAMRKPGKDNSGEKVYLKKADGSPEVDPHNHPVVEHDLYSVAVKGGENEVWYTPEGIAEAFREFAVREGLSFFGGARFDEERYSALRGGLEISEVMLSEIAGSGRLDAEYYSKHNTYLQAKLDELGTRTIAECGGYLDCSAFYPSVADYYNSADANVPFIRVNDINGGVITITDATVFLPKKVLAENRKTMASAWPGDIVIAKGGTIAKVGLATEDYPYYATSRDVIILRTDKLQGLNRYYLWAFLHSSYGRGILMRSASQTIQPHLTLPAILAIKIPEFTTIEPMIEKMYREAVNMKRESTALYAAAQSLLSSRLGQVPKDSRSTAVRSLSEAFSAGRLDAEYFMPKYDGLFALLDTLHTKPLGEIVSITKSIEPGSSYYTTEGVPFIRVSDITAMGISSPEIHIPHDTVPDIEKLYPQKDTVLLSKDGSVGIAYKVSEDLQAVTSGALLHLRVKDTYEILPDYLTLVLNSEIVQLQAERDTNGAIIQHWRLEDIAKVIIPILDSDTQTSIAHSLQRSFTLRKNSDSLIRSAVHAVELAVESSEQSALTFINTKEEFLPS